MKNDIILHFDEVNWFQSKFSMPLKIVLFRYRLNLIYEVKYLRDDDILMTQTRKSIKKGKNQK